MTKTKLSSPLREVQKGLSEAFKDNYVFEFLNLPDPHNESDLQKAILQNLKKFFAGVQS